MYENRVKSIPFCTWVAAARVFTWVVDFLVRIHWTWHQRWPRASPPYKWLTAFSAEVCDPSRIPIRTRCHPTIFLVPHTTDDWQGVLSIFIARTFLYHFIFTYTCWYLSTSNMDKFQAFLSFISSTSILIWQLYRVALHNIPNLLNIPRVLPAKLHYV